MSRRLNGIYSAASCRLRCQLRASAEILGLQVQSFQQARLQQVSEMLAQVSLSHLCQHPRKVGTALILVIVLSQVLRPWRWSKHSL